MLPSEQWIILQTSHFLLIHKAMGPRFTTALLTTVNTFLCGPFCFAANLVTEVPATPDMAIGTSTLATQLSGKFEASIVLKEISFKNSSADYFIFHVQSEEEKVNLRGLEFFDDKVFKTVETDLWVKPSQQIYFQFNAAGQEDQDGLQSKDDIARLFSAQKGLTGTSEQLLISHGKKPLAFFCWFKPPVAAAEVKQFPSVVSEELWEDADIESCYPSDTVKNNQSLIKTGDENNASAWEILETDQQNNTTNKEESKKTAVVSLENLIESGGNTDPQSIPELIITEIFPAPAGKESFEWIELLNQSDQTISLHNWIIDDASGGSKPRRLEGHLISPGATAQISLKEYKIVLNNNSDSVRLFLPDGSPVGEQEYDGAKKGFSYALILHDGEETWQWTSSPTPGQPNPELTTVSGIISAPAIFGEIYHFSLQSAEHSQETALTTTNETNRPDQINGDNDILVIFSEDVIKGPLAKEIFRAGSSGIFTGELSEAPANRGNFSHLLKLYSYELGGDAMASPPQWPAAPSGAAGLLLLAAPALLGGGGYWLWKRKQLSADGKYLKLENATPLQETNNGQSIFQIP